MMNMIDVIKIYANYLASYFTFSNCINIVVIRTIQIMVKDKIVRFQHGIINLKIYQVCNTINQFNLTKYVSEFFILLLK